MTGGAEVEEIALRMLFGKGEEFRRKKCAYRIGMMEKLKIVQIK